MLRFTLSEAEGDLTETVEQTAAIYKVVSVSIGSYNLATEFVQDQVMTFTTDGSFGVVMAYLVGGSSELKTVPFGETDDYGISLKLGDAVVHPPNISNTLPIDTSNIRREV